MDELLNDARKAVQHVTAIEAKLLLRRDLNRAIKIMAAVERERLTSAYADVIKRRQKQERTDDARSRE